MKYIIILIIILLFLSPAFAGQLKELPEIFNPSSISINDQYIYIVQDVNVFVYSLKDFKLVTKFGKAGEGPQEFMKIPQPWLPNRLNSGYHIR